MQYRTRIITALTAIIFLLVGCAPSAVTDTSGLSGRILLWHSWEASEAAVLEQIVANFQELHPDVGVVISHVPDNQMRAEYERTAALGLGPDLFIGSSDWIGDFATQELIRPIEENSLNPSTYYPAAVNLSTFQGKLLAVPLSLQTPALFINRQLTPNTPATLDDLFEEANSGRLVAIETGFDAAYWGIRAFGNLVFTSDGALFDSQVGFVNWLQWLQQARENPNFILSQDAEGLQRLFMDGKVAYYIGPSTQLQRFQAALDLEGEPSSVNVVPLPLGPGGVASPIIRAEVFMLNSASSDDQAAVSLALALFLSNAQQSTTLMRDADMVPANQRVRVPTSIYPNVAGFVAQGRTAVSLPPAYNTETVRALGDDVYTAVLSGVKSPAEAVCEFRIRVQRLDGSDTATTDPAELCADSS